MSRGSGARFGDDDDPAKLPDPGQARRISEADSPALLETLFTAAPIGFGFFDRDLRYVRVNEALAAINGRSVADHLGRSIHDVLPGLAQVVVPPLERALETGETIIDLEVSGTIDATTGQIGYWLTSFYPLRSPEGSIIGAGFVVRDIAVRRRAEAALRESDERFRILAAHAPVVIFLTDARGEPTFLSERASTLSGRPIREILGKGWIETLHADDRDRIVQEWTRAAQTGKDYSSESRILGPSGEEIWVIAHAVALRDAGGKITGYLGTIQDIGDRHRAMDQLAEQRAFLRQVNDLNPSFVFAKDRSGRFTLVNQAIAETYGAPVETIIGKTDADFDKNAEEVEHFRRDDLEVMDTGKDKFIAEEMITDSTGRRRYLQTIKRPIIGPDGRADQVLGVSTDITVRKALEEQLLHAQKMEAIGRLAGGIAHDFNNLLTVILGSSEMILESLGPDHPLHGSADHILKSAERAAMLTRQLVAFSRKQILQPRVLDLNRIVKESLQMIRPLIGEDVALVTALEAESPNVKADPMQITQVILNLAINARDAMSAGGTLTIRTSNITLDEDYVATHPDAAPGDHVTIAVSDTGHGIAPDVLPHIFEPFFTTKKPGLGTGLGLATTYGIVQQSGGRIEVSTEPDRGTTFIVYLPRVSEPAEDPEHAAGWVVGGREIILLVEDEPMVRAVASSTLRAKGYQVLEACNGEEALSVAATHAGPIDLVITDVVMPQMGGLELAAQLAKQRPGTKVLYTSGYTEESIAQRGGSGTEVSFLPKPYMPEALTRRVREALDTPGR